MKSKHHDSSEKGDKEMIKWKQKNLPDYWEFLVNENENHLSRNKELVNWLLPKFPHLISKWLSTYNAQWYFWSRILNSNY